MLHSSGSPGPRELCLVRPPKPTAPETPSSFSDSPEDLASPPSPPPPPYQLPLTGTPAPALPSQPDSSPPSEDLSSPVSSHTHSRLNLEPLDSRICPLREVAGAEGVARVHVPFSLTDLSSAEKRLVFPPLTTVIPKRRALPSPCPSSQAVNCDKLREVTQGPGENPALFLNRLTEAMMLHTRLDLASNAGATVLATDFISQSAPDIRRKF